MSIDHNTAQSVGPTETVQLAIGGMTCGSCAARVEKQLNQLDGVEATVNFATEQARVTYAEPITADDLVGAVTATGYTADLLRQPGSRRFSPKPPAEARGHDDAVRALLRRVLVSLALAVPVIALAMVPARTRSTSRSPPE